jgi:hypothetical protein
MATAMMPVVEDVRRNVDELLSLYEASKRGRPGSCQDVSLVRVQTSTTPSSSQSHMGLL